MTSFTHDLSFGSDIRSLGTDIPEFKINLVRLHLKIFAINYSCDRILLVSVTLLAMWLNPIVELCLLN